MQPALEFFVAVFALAPFGILVVGRCRKHLRPRAIGHHGTTVGALSVGSFDTRQRLLHPADEPAGVVSGITEIHRAFHLGAWPISGIESGPGDPLGSSLAALRPRHCPRSVAIFGNTTFRRAHGTASRCPDRWCRALPRRQRNAANGEKGPGQFFFGKTAKLLTKSQTGRPPFSFGNQPRLLTNSVRAEHPARGKDSFTRPSSAGRRPRAANQRGSTW